MQRGQKGRGIRPGAVDAKTAAEALTALSMAGQRGARATKKMEKAFASMAKVSSDDLVELSNDFPEVEEYEEILEDETGTQGLIRVSPERAVSGELSSWEVGVTVFEGNGNISIDDYLRTKEGKKAILKVIGRNGERIKEILEPEAPASRKPRKVDMG